LQRGDKSLIGNNGLRRLVTGSGARWCGDETKVAEEARYHGKWILRTNTELSGPAAKPALWLRYAIRTQGESSVSNEPGVQHGRAEAGAGRIRD